MTVKFALVLETDFEGTGKTGSCLKRVLRKESKLMMITPRVRASEKLISVWKYEKKIFLKS